MDKIINKINTLWGISVAAKAVEERVEDDENE